MGQCYDQLSLRERMTIDLLLSEGLSQSQIAIRLGRSRSTITREVRRNARPTKRWRGPYDGVRADGLAARRRQWDARFKLARQPDLAAEVKRRLAMGLSPEQVAGRLARENGRTIVSHESIYRFIAHRSRCRDPSWRRLLLRATRRRGHPKPRGGSLVRLMKHRVSITLRPSVVAGRIEPGHWEGDLMTFRRNRQSVLVLHERVSRFTLAWRIPDKNAATVADRLTAFFRTLPPWLGRSVTFDNGGEFAHHYRIAENCGVATYFCDAHAPWQKGGIENAIGRLRRALPSKIDLDTIAPHHLQAAVTEYNATPRKVLAYAAAAEVFSSLNNGALQT